MKIKSIKKTTLKTKGPISKLAYSNSEQMIAIVQNNSHGGSILSFVNADNQEVIFIKTFQNAAIISINFYNHILCLAKNNNSITLVDTRSQEEMGSFRVDNKVNTIKIYDDLLLIEGTRLEIWNWRQQKKQWVLNNYIAGTITENWSYDDLNCNWKYSDYLKKQPYINSPALGILLNKKNDILICGNNSAQLFVLSWIDNKVKKEVFGAPLQINHVTISRTGKYLLASGKIPDADFLWKGKSYKRHLDDLFNEDFRSSNISKFNPNEKNVARGFLNGHIIINDLDNRDAVFMKKLHNGEITGLCYNKTGDILYSSGLDGELNIIAFE